MKKIPLFVILMISFLITSVQLVVTPAIIPTDGVQNILAGSGVSISNILFTGNMNALGSFTTNSVTGLGFSSGLVLSTGLVSNVADSSFHNASTDNGAGSDPQLAVLVSEDINDAAVWNLTLFLVQIRLSLDMYLRRKSIRNLLMLVLMMFLVFL